MALAMKALPGLQAKLAGSRVTASRPTCSIRRLPVQQRIVSVATASADAPQTDSEKEQILKEIESVNAELTAAGVSPELLAIWEDGEDVEDDGEDDGIVVGAADPMLGEYAEEDEYEGPEALVSTIYNEETDSFLGTEVLYDFDGELVKDTPEAEAFLKTEYPSWFADAEEVVEEAEAEATEDDEEADYDYDEADLDQSDLAEREELTSAMDKRDEALTLLKSWTPEMLEELYPNGKVPGFNKKQSKDLWRALRYFLAVEAVDAAYEVQNLETEGDIVELDDDDDFEEEDMDEDTAADVALHEEYDALATEFDVSVNPKDRVYGTVYRVTEDGAYVELAGKSSGYVPLSECSVAKLSSPTEVLVVGSKREFVVLDVDDVYGEVILSLRAMEWDVLWRRVQQLQEEDVTVYVTVTDFNNGGLTVDYQGIEGFIPIAQFGNKLQLENLEELVGMQVPCKIFEASQEDERIVLSNKRAISDGYSQNFNPGDVLAGVIQSVKPYGAFVDLGGVTGLLHISQISHDRVMDVTKVFSEGDKLKVMVLSTDKDRGRVTLSTKKLEPTPGDMIRAPDLVYENAEEIAAVFKERMTSANDLSEPPPATDFEAGYDAMATVVPGGYTAPPAYGYDYAAGQQVASDEFAQAAPQDAPQDYQQ